MSKTIFTIIGWLSVVTIPVAPAYFFGEAVMQQASKHASYTLAVIVGICAAAGMEGVGIYSGHTAVQAFRLGRWYLGSFAAAILAAYVIIGASKLTGFGQTMFFVAPLSYLILGINHAVEVAEEREKAAEEQAKKQADSNRELEQQREEERRKEEADMAAQQRAEEADRVARRDQLAAERQARLDAQNAEKERLAHEERMAKIAAKTAATSRKDSGKLPLQVAANGDGLRWDYTDWRKVPHEAKQQIATMTAPQLAAIMPHLADTTRRLWVRKAAAQFAAIVPTDSPLVGEQRASGD
jgi:flagellar biosynthesis GTPase FlhF